MFNKAILAAALLSVGAITAGTAASAAEIGVRHTHGTSWSNTYNGTRTFESDTQTATVSDYRAGAVTVTASSPLAAAQAAGYIETVGTAVLDLDVLELGIEDLSSSVFNAGDDADGPTSATIGSGGSSDPASATSGEEPAVYATVTASVRREASFGFARTMSNESSNFDAGTRNTFSSVSTFAQ